MEKINQYFTSYGIYCFCVFSLILSPVEVTANTDCYCYFCGDQYETEKEIDYEGLGEYEEMFREFEAQVDDEEGGLVAKTFFLKKWCKKAERWFKKTLAKLLKKLIGYENFKSGEYCAYEIAKFKRDVDKKVYNTGDIETMLSEFSCVTNDSAYSGLENFRNKIRYYYHNKDATPPKHPNHNRYDFSFNCSTQKHNELDSIPIRALIGSVEVSCGFLIQVLPFPGCLWLGRALIGHGFTQIYEGYMTEYEEENNAIANF